MSNKPSSPSAETALSHPIQVVVRRTGLSPDVLRVWERRHDAVQPTRSAGRQRLYTEADIARLSLLGQLTRRGHRIGELARLAEPELKGLLQQDAEAQVDSQRAGPSTTEEERLQTALACVESLDSQGLEDLLEAASVVLGAERLMDGLIFPLLQQIGDRWSSGRLRPSHEHLATTAIRRALANALARLPASADAPVAVFTTPQGNRHELGALAAAVSSASLGWRVTFLGPDVPAEDIAATARDVGADVVGLSITCDDELAVARTQVELIAQLLPAGTSLVVGGHGAGAIADELTGRGVRVVTNLLAFQDLLQELAARRSS